jgi:hypothetical protein
MGFFNSLSTRIPLAVMGGVLYGLLTYRIASFFSLSSEFSRFAAILVFLFYLGSRLLILFSGIDSPYYSRKGRALPPLFTENESFYRTGQWVGKFYHYHDIALFVFIVITSVVFIATLLADWSGGKPLGDTFQNLLSF